MNQLASGKSLGQQNKFPGSGIETIASDQRTELVVHQHLRTRRVHCQPCRATTGCCADPVHAGHLPIFKPEHIDPIGTEISTDEKLSGGVKYERMWMCRRLSLRMDTAADFFDDLSNGAN